MVKEEIQDHIDFVQARIEDFDKRIINMEPTDEGYKEILTIYNKLIDRYQELLDKLENFERKDIEFEKIELEQDRNYLEKERLYLDREKFAHDVQKQKEDEIIEIIFEILELIAKIGVPTISGWFALKLALLAYSKDLNLDLCNGRIWGLLKQLKM